MTNLQKLTAIIVEAVPEIKNISEPKDWWITRIEIIDIFKSVLGEQYQKRFNKHLDYDQWGGIRDAMEQAGRLSCDKIYNCLSDNREAIGRPINLEDCLFCIINKPNKDWEWKDKAREILFDNWELMKPLSEQDEETINKLLEILQ